MAQETSLYVAVSDVSWALVTVSPSLAFRCQ